MQGSATTSDNAFEQRRSKQLFEEDLAPFEEDEFPEALREDYEGLEGEELEEEREEEAPEEQEEGEEYREEEPYEDEY